MIALLLAEISPLHRFIATKAICILSLYNNIKNILTGNTGIHQCRVLMVCN